MEKDRNTIGLTTTTQASLRRIEEKGWFRDGQDVARFCLAYAVRNSVQEGTTQGTDTRWAAGNFDSSGEIRSLMSALYPRCSTPVRLMEHLVNEGLQLVAERLRDGGVSPSVLLADGAGQAES